MKNQMVRGLVALLAVILCEGVSAQGLQSLGGRRLGGPRGQNARRQQTPATAASNAEQSSGTTGEAGASAFNWDATPVDIILQAYGERTGKTILKDPQVPAATITLKSRPGQKLTDEEYLEAIETILEMNQIHLEPYGESFIRALPRKDVRKEGIPLYMDAESMEADFKGGKINDGKVISLMIQFTNIATEEAQKALEGFKSNSGILLVFERTNSILVTDTKQNIDRMMEIAKKIDIASPVTEVVEYIQIKYASANDVKTVIDNIVQESMKEQEKNGKAPQNQPQSQQPYRPLLGGLRRTGQNQQQPQAPVNNASLVMTVSDADRGMIRGKVVTIADERSNKILIITSASNMKFFKEVIAALDVETNPDTVVKVYRLKYAEAEDVSDMINDLIGNSSSSKNSGRANQNQNAKKGTSGNVTRGNQTAAKKPANQRSGDVKAGELNKDNTTVLADKRINGIVVMTDKELVPTIEQIIESMDIKLSQVLIETCIVEVSLGDDLSTGVNWARMGDKKDKEINLLGSHGLPMYYYSDGEGNIEAFEDTGAESIILGEKTWTKFGNPLTRVVGGGREGFASKEGDLTSLLGGGGSSEIAASTLSALASVGTNALSSVSPAGSGLNWFFKSDNLNIAAVIQASKTDSRTKYLASPVVMTLDNKEAVINATEMSYLLKGFTSSGNSYSTIAVPDYEQKELGIEIKVTPKINPNGTVMLTVETKYTQESGSQKIKYATGGVNGESHLEDVPVPLTATREMSSDVLLENRQTVVFGGLVKRFKSESETGIPILKDIPIIGKWLFGSVTERESRNELLVFMTPYVLDEGEAAQAEALRRKKTMSDQRPWEDYGWSASTLADPVGQHEQMRRLKEEWKKQDEERQTKIAIEKMKVDRAKKLKEMSKEERNLWLKMHKEELEDEEQEKLEEQMLDPKSQEALKKLAAEIREKKLSEAKKEIDEAEKASLGENERARLDREAKEAKEPKELRSEPLQATKPSDESVLGRLSEEVK